MEGLVYIPILFVAIAPALYAMVQYNALVSLRNHIRESWSDIDTELKRRYDLIPRLVEVARAYAAHERQIFERVIALRDRCAANQGPVSSQVGDETELVRSLQSFLATVEAYPELKANAQFRSLHAELVNTEDRIQAARRFYNGNVRDYSNKRESFPGSIVASLFSFAPAALFSVEPAVREGPSVQL
ncbi:MAG: LemA family protein [Terrimicrobiaceae bacterium]|nr:LemA family protein [Terrimicrobiaceae bacterium]